MAAQNPARKMSLLASTAVARISLIGLASTLALACGANAQGLPTGGSVSAGTASITGTATSTTITQSSASAAINWASFNIAPGNSVQFVQPSSQSVALNRVLGPDASLIAGTLSANGKVFLINPNGVLFSQTARVDVGGLIASTLGMSDADFMAGDYRFAGTGGGGILNQGTISATDGGYVALLGANVSNEGTIIARFGTVALAAGTAITMDVAGDGLLNVKVDTGAVNALIANGGLIRADGGNVLLTTQAAGQLLHTAVNNSGVIEARTLESRQGTILLLGDMQSGTLSLTGTLDASAPGSGDGGFIETSAANVTIASSAYVTTEAPAGLTGTWLIDPQDFVIGAAGNISGATLSALLVTNSVTITTAPGPDATVPGTPPSTTLGTTVTGNGDIIVNDAIAWTAAPSTTTLRLNADRDVRINAPITATNGNIVACCGRDIAVNGALTTTNGSILLNAGRDVKVMSAIVTTDGNIALCAGIDVRLMAALTLTRGSLVPAQSLGLNPGLLIIAGAAGTGPGIAGGTLTFAPLAPPATVTGPNAAVLINYNPISYALPTDYSPMFTLTLGATVMQRMLLFPNGSRAETGTTGTTLDGFNTTATSGLPTGVTLVAGAGSRADFDDPNAGSGIGITYTGYSLSGPNAGQYALASSCCVPALRTTGTISTLPPAPPPPPPSPPPPSPPPPPPPPPPVITPPVVVPPVTVIPPVTLPDGGTQLVETTVILAPTVPLLLDTVIIDQGVLLPGTELASLSRPAPVIVPPVIPARPRIPFFPPKQDRN